MSKKEELTAVFSNLREHLMAPALRLLHDREDAEDALMEAFCKLWKRRQDISDEKEALRLSKTTVKNTSIDLLRQRKVRMTDPLTPEMDVEVETTEEIEDERRTLFLEVEKIITSQLSPIQQIVIHKKEMEGESIRQIAQELEMTESAVAMQLSRARKIVREEYLKRVRS